VEAPEATWQGARTKGSAKVVKPAASLQSKAGSAGAGEQCPPMTPHYVPDPRSAREQYQFGNGVCTRLGVGHPGPKVSSLA